MTMPVWMLLAFASWTLLLLMFTIGIYRWQRILLNGAGIASFPGGAISGDDWYARATRAHANCVENLPVFTVAVMALQLSNISGSLVNNTAVIIVVARVLQSLIHVLYRQTDLVVAFRFSFFFVQLAGFVTLILITVLKNLG